MNWPRQTLARDGLALTPVPDTDPDTGRLDDPRRKTSPGRDTVDPGSFEPSRLGSKCRRRSVNLLVALGSARVEEDTLNYQLGMPEVQRPETS